MEKFLSSNYLVNNWVPVLITIPFEFEGALVLKPTVPSSPRLLKHRRPFESVKGHWVKSPGFVLTDQDLHPSRPRLSQGHIIHAHLTYGNTGGTHRGQFPQT